MVYKRGVGVTWLVYIVLILIMQANQTTKTRAYLLTQQPQTSQLIAQLELNTQESKASLARRKVSSLRMLANGFISYLCAPKGEQVEVEQVMRLLAGGQGYNVKGIDFGVLLGMAVKEQIMGNGMLASVKEKVDELMGWGMKKEESEDEADLSIDFGDDLVTNTKSSIQNFQLIPNIYAQTQAGSSTKDSLIHISFGSSEQNYNDFSILNLDEHSYNSENIENEDKQIMQYLYKLSQPTTELSYLCQRLKWPQPEAVEEKSKINQMLFACTVKVSVKFRESFYVLESQCPGAVSKKEAKRNASLFLLRKIYHRFGEIWKIFKQCRAEHPSIQQPLNANNEQIFKKAKLNLAQGEIFKQEQKQNEPKNEFSPKINQYLDSIKSYKAELNVLQGRHNKKITQVEFEREKQDDLSLWPIKASLYDNQELLEAEAREASKKISEEKCCRDLLFKIYMRDIGRWETFRAYKQSKGLE